ncbi:MAG: V-type ATP synthase subunit D [Planctomycetes bacterium]|nr:V-type ATP synthase subunit D [Planctomycetota bacterium]
MAKLNVPLTKTSYFRLKRELAFAEEGFDLLDQKREILIMELMRLVHRARSIQEEVAEKLKAAYRALEQAMLESGAFELGREAVHAQYDHKVDISLHRLMGISMPAVEAKHEEMGVRYSMASSSPRTDEATRCFLDALDGIRELAEVETKVWRLAREVKKTQRRVNALEKIFIPDYKETQDHIISTLEEKEREAFFVMKMLKARLTAQREEARKDHV